MTSSTCAAAPFFRQLVAALSVAASFAGLAPAAAQPPRAALPPGYTTSRTGGRHDFEYFAGAWRTVQHRLKVRGKGSTAWETFPATLCMEPYLEGLVTVDEMYMPTRGTSGVTIRTFDLQKRQWTIYWVSSLTGILGVPGVVGGFQGNHGEFYGADEDNGRPVKVRFIWDKLDRDHARWAQAFSYDNRSWETNWVADFTRADPASTCRNNRPRHGAPAGTIAPGQSGRNTALRLAP